MLSSGVRIVVDDAVEAADELLGPLGQLTVMPAREITRTRLVGADALVIRSGVRAGRDLLEGTGVRFVGTATAGLDHLDEAWLEGAGVGFAGAPGCNARAVGEWVVAALLAIGDKLGTNWEGKCLGVVGVGHVGRIVADFGAALGMRVVLCDPPRARVEGGAAFVSLERLLAEAEVVSLHVPLTRAGGDATWRMIDARRVASMRDRAVLINASRGEVVETPAMIAARTSGKLAAIACDVWDLEPRVDEALLDVADIMTPHIAGYSLEGKVAGTRMVAEAIGRYFGLRAGRSGPAAESAGGLIRIQGGGEAGIRGISGLVKSAYDILEDGRRLRNAVGALGGGPETMSKLRRDYPLRREFSSYEVEVEIAPSRSAAACGLQDTMRRLGFRVRE